VEAMEQIGYDGAFSLKSSAREHTPAWEMQDDVPDDVKTERINEIIALQNRLSLAKNTALVGATVEVLVEGPSRKSDREMQGRTDGNKMAVFPGTPDLAGSIVPLEIRSANSATLFGTIPRTGHAGREAGQERTRVPSC